jgi:hypothetical protein
MDVVLDQGCESLLRQSAADVELTPEQLARVLLESALILRQVDVA